LFVFSLCFEILLFPCAKQCTLKKHKKPKKKQNAICNQQLPEGIENGLILADACFRRSHLSPRRFLRVEFQAYKKKHASFRRRHLGVLQGWDGDDWAFFFCWLVGYDERVSVREIHLPNLTPSMPLCIRYLPLLHLCDQPNHLIYSSSTTSIVPPPLNPQRSASLCFYEIIERLWSREKEQLANWSGKTVDAKIIRKKTDKEEGYSSSCEFRNKPKNVCINAVIFVSVALRLYNQLTSCNEMNAQSAYCVLVASLFACLSISITHTVHPSDRPTYRPFMHEKIIRVVYFGSLPCLLVFFFLIFSRTQPHFLWELGSLAHCWSFFFFSF
jgi:hypothetical protein